MHHSFVCMNLNDATYCLLIKPNLPNSIKATYLSSLLITIN